MPCTSIRLIAFSAHFRTMSGASILNFISISACSGLSIAALTKTSVHVSTKDKDPSQITTKLMFYLRCEYELQIVRMYELSKNRATTLNFTFIVPQSTDPFNL